jgi:hypothetical protein
VIAATSPVSSFLISWRRRIAFIFDFQHSGANSDNVTSVQLTLVLDPLLDGSHACVFFPEACPR